jgi:hypothetical protein
MPAACTGGDSIPLSRPVITQMYCPTTLHTHLLWGGRQVGVGGGAYLTVVSNRSNTEQIRGNHLLRRAIRKAKTTCAGCALQKLARGWAEPK